MQKVTRKAVSVLAGFVLLASTTPALAADSYRYFATPVGDGNYLVVIEEPGDVSNNSTLAVQPPRASVDARGSWLWCSGPGDKTCDFDNPALDILASQVLPNCSETKEEICIESLQVASPGKEFQEATFLRTAKGGIRYSASSDLNLHEGSTPSLYSVPASSESASVANYAVTLKMTQWFNHGTHKFDNGPLILSVAPYKELSCNYKAMYFDKSAKADKAYAGGWNAGVFTEDGNCGANQDFASGTRARVTFHVPSDIAGWFSGRMKNPEIAISSLSKSANKVTVSAESVTVPRLALVRKASDMTEKEKNFNIGRWGIDNGVAFGLRAFDQEVMDFVDYYRPLTKDTAAGANSYWNMQTASAGRGSACLSDSSKVLGVVTTNSMGYSGDSPSFANGMLDYKVAGLHFMPDGLTPVEGSYDLVMRSDTARCLYGFSKAPIAATISITGSNGETKTATTVVSEKDGWLKMAAYGFTFSSPTISVKLTQASSATSKKTTITCAKGKLTKKITAVGPKCPAGYKKK